MGRAAFVCLVQPWVFSLALNIEVEDVSVSDLQTAVYAGKFALELIRNQHWKFTLANRRALDPRSGHANVRLAIRAGVLESMRAPREPEA